MAVLLLSGSTARSHLLDPLILSCPGCAARNESALSGLLPSLEDIQRTSTSGRERPAEPWRFVGHLGCRTGEDANFWIEFALGFAAQALREDWTSKEDRKTPGSVAELRAFVRTGASTMPHMSRHATAPVCCLSLISKTTPFRPSIASPGNALNDRRSTNDTDKRLQDPMSCLL